MQTQVRLKSFAKLNLALNVVGIEEDYHKIDSLVTSINLYDWIELKTRHDKEICVTMEGKGYAYIPIADNNAYKAARLFMDFFKTNGADIHIYKNIPVGAGLGGSSADCAGVLNAMAHAYGIRDRNKLKELADTLGSDTGYMLHGGLARLSGRGEKVQKLAMQGKLYFLLLFPKGSVNTAKCYKKFDSLAQHEQTDIDKLIVHLQKMQLTEATTFMKNALQASAMAINKNIEPALQMLQNTESLATLITGSGSCIYGTFLSYSSCRMAQRICRKINSKIVIPIKKGYQCIIEEQDKREK